MTRLAHSVSFLHNVMYRHWQMFINKISLHDTSQCSQFTVILSKLALARDNFQYICHIVRKLFGRIEFDTSRISYWTPGRPNEARMQLFLFVILMFVHICSSGSRVPNNAIIVNQITRFYFIQNHCAVIS